MQSPMWCFSKKHTFNLFYLLLSESELHIAWLLYISRSIENEQIHVNLLKSAQFWNPPPKKKSDLLGLVFEMEHL